jgi:hypothetical protein
LTQYALSAQAPNSGGLAGSFFGKVDVTGTLTASSKNFRIDHPADPANKYLVHSCVESNDMKTIYDGIATLSSDGRAIVELPSYFESLNKGFRYQLTAIGAPGPGLYIEKEIEDNRFAIAGGDPGMRVSWQVTGIRKDRYALAHPLQVEQPKQGQERGKYLNAAEYGKPESLSIAHRSLAKLNVPAPKPPSLRQPGSALRSFSGLHVRNSGGN